MRAARMLLRYCELAILAAQVIADPDKRDGFKSKRRLAQDESSGRQWPSGSSAWDRGVSSDTALASSTYESMSFDQNTNSYSTSQASSLRGTINVSGQDSSSMSMSVSTTMSDPNANPNLWETRNIWTQTTQTTSNAQTMQTSLIAPDGSMTWSMPSRSSIWPTTCPSGLTQTVIRTTVSTMWMTQTQTTTSTQTMIATYTSTTTATVSRVTPCPPPMTSTIAVTETQTVMITGSCPPSVGNSCPPAGEMTVVTTTTAGGSDDGSVWNQWGRTTTQTVTVAQTVAASACPMPVIEVYTVVESCYAAVMEGADTSTMQPMSMGGRWTTLTSSGYVVSTSSTTTSTTGQSTTLSSVADPVSTSGPISVGSLDSTTSFVDPSATSLLGGQESTTTASLGRLTSTFMGLMTTVSASVNSASGFVTASPAGASPTMSRRSLRARRQYSTPAIQIVTTSTTSEMALSTDTSRMPATSTDVQQMGGTGSYTSQIAATVFNNAAMAQTMGMTQLSSQTSCLATITMTVTQPCAGIQTVTNWPSCTTTSMMMGEGSGGLSSSSTSSKGWNDWSASPPTLPAMISPMMASSSISSSPPASIYSIVTTMMTSSMASNNWNTWATSPAVDPSISTSSTGSNIRNVWDASPSGSTVSSTSSSMDTGMGWNVVVAAVPITITTTASASEMNVKMDTSGTTTSTTSTSSLLCFRTNDPNFTPGLAVIPKSIATQLGKQIAAETATLGTVTPNPYLSTSAFSSPSTTSASIVLLPGGSGGLVSTASVCSTASGTLPIGLHTIPRATELFEARPKPTGTAAAGLHEVKLRTVG